MLLEKNAPTMDRKPLKCVRETIWWYKRCGQFHRKQNTPRSLPDVAFRLELPLIRNVLLNTNSMPLFLHSSKNGTPFTGLSLVVRRIHSSDTTILIFVGFSRDFSVLSSVGRQVSVFSILHNGYIKISMALVDANIRLFVTHNGYNDNL